MVGENYVWCLVIIFILFTENLEKQSGGRWEGGFTAIISGGKATKEREIVMEGFEPYGHY